MSKCEEGKFKRKATCVTGMFGRPRSAPGRFGQFGRWRPASAPGSVKLLSVSLSLSC